MHRWVHTRSFCVSGPVSVSWPAVQQLEQEHSPQGSKMEDQTILKMLANKLWRINLTKLKHEKYHQMSYVKKGDANVDELFGWNLFISSYHGVYQSHANLLMLNIGVVEADRDFHLVEYGEGVLLYLQSGTLNSQTAGNLLNASKQGFFFISNVK